MYFTQDLIKRKKRKGGEGKAGREERGRRHTYLLCARSAVIDAWLHSPPPLHSLRSTQDTQERSTHAYPWIRRDHAAHMSTNKRREGQCMSGKDAGHSSTAGISHLIPFSSLLLAYYLHNQLCISQTPQHNILYTSFLLISSIS